ncbi:efflux RND transporter periplasmic adaptor subunit [Telmatobacter bradus]|uniref:efflux RND transporter periplasmic adaptor subunit n=1 Tax=Telmatobacter bradus TaxID=474953 RepID=UPI003B430525
MKRMIVSLLFSALIFSGCKRKPAENADNAKQQPETQQNGLLQMSLSAQQHIGLQTAPAALTHMQEYLRATGTVQPIDSRVASVRPLARGRIVEVHAKVGDRVKAGQTLAVFDNIEAGELIAQLQSARAELEQRKARLSPARRQTERSRRLADIGAGAEKDFESSQAEQQEIEANIRSQQAAINGLEVRLHRLGIANASARSSFLTALKAPFAGVVTKAQVSTGDFIDESREVFAIANLTQVWVQAEVYEKDLGRIRVGQNASITVDTYPNERFAGRVAYISDVLDPQTRTARVRCEVANGDLKLKTDMFASIELPTKFDKQAVTVPTSALQEVEGKSVVFVRRSSTQFEKREVEKGAIVNGQAEIVRGLKAGEPVITQGSFHLKSILAGGELGEE